MMQEAVDGAAHMCRWGQYLLCHVAASSGSHQLPGGCQAVQAAPVTCWYTSKPVSASV